MKIKLTKKQYSSLLNEMRFDGKSTGLFGSEEPEETKPINEFGEKFKEGWGNFLSAAKREGKETAMAAEILKRIISRKEVSKSEKKFLKSQSMDLLKIVGVLGLGAVSSVIPIALEKILNKKDMSIMPSKQETSKEDPETGEDLSEGRKKKKKSKKKSTTLCARGKNAAKAKYDVYPSAYANGYAVQVCKGKIKGLDGTKKCSGSYCSGKKNESWSPELEQDLEAFHDIKIHEDLATWFGTKKKKKGSKQPQGPWVNICKKKKGGGHPDCGRDDSDKGGYPVCRAKSVASNMSQEKKDSACRRKRDKEKNDGKSGKGQSPSPIKVKGYEPKKRKSKKNESVNINRMLITESKTIISENLRYHIDNQIPLVENIYRYGSEGYFNLINEVRGIYGKGQVDLSDLDKELIKTDIGKKVLFEGKEVWLDIPMEDNEVLTEAKFKGKTVKTSSPQRSSSGGKAYKVYVSGCVKKTKSNPSGVKQIRFGSGGLRAKLTQPDRKKAYDNRHGCSKGKHNDKCMAGYWSCRLPRYAKKLGLSGGGTWW
ncbi:MAG: hypothetical protein ACW980_20255 [Promethearchaeota archaeon]|jgi:hypothetical protein